MPRITSRPSDLADRWELRAPLLYGSRHVGYYATEADAMRAGVKLSVAKYGGETLQVIKKTKTVYINRSED